MRFLYFTFLMAGLPGILAGKGMAQEEIPVITVRTPSGWMKYDRPVITAPPGTMVRLVFENQDEMPHNLVLCHPLPGKNDKGMEVALLAWELGAEGMAKEWVPESPRIIAHSGMVAAHEKKEILLKIPDQPGVYPYVCTFPGHAMAMNGELRVLAEGPRFSKLDYQLFLGDWNELPDFSKLEAHRKGAIPEQKLTIKLEGMTEHFGVRYDGELEVPEDGRYWFYLASDDGSELSIDGKSLIRMDGIRAVGEVNRRQIRLKKGTAKVRVDYFEQAGEEQLYLAWSGRNFSETPLSDWIHPNRDPNRQPMNPDTSTGIPLAPANGEAIIYRNFIEGAGPRGIAVGYPNGVNLCFDADQMAPVFFWQGAFMDAKRHWTDRGNGTQPPLGYNLFRVGGDGPGVALLTGTDAEWPGKTPRAELLRFRGYRLDARRFPSFRFEMGSTSITESYQPEGTIPANDLRITRTLYFNDPQPVENLYVKAAGGILEAGEDGSWQGEGFRLTIEEGIPEQRGNQLLVKVPFAGTTGTVSLTYHWDP